MNDDIIKIVQKLSESLKENQRTEITSILEKCKKVISYDNFSIAAAIVYLGCYKTEPITVKGIIYLGSLSGYYFDGTKITKMIYELRSEMMRCAI